MERADTAMGGEADQFRSTMWSDILAAADPALPESRARLDRLLRTYWKPVFAYVRTGWRKSVEDAKDLTQSFFTHILENEFLAKVRPEGGSFRGYLKRSLRNFMIDAARSEAARRPKGDAIPLELGPQELDRLCAATPGESPEQAYDREWFHGLLEAATEALRRWLDGHGKSRHFQVFSRYCFDPIASGPEEEAPTYESIGKSLGLSPSDVRHHLEYCRQIFRKLLKERIRDYVAGDDVVEQELKEVMRE